MAWIKPKTDWKSKDYFNLDPDYARIKGNIEFLRGEISGLPELHPMKSYTMSDEALPEFFNNVVDNVKILISSMIPEGEYPDMKRYAGNQRFWNENELNNIEKNIELVYNVYKGQQNILPKLAFQLGGSEF